MMKYVPAKLNGQTLREYAVLIGIISAALMSVSPFLKRSIQSVVKVTTDQMQPQNDADQLIDKSTGYLENAFITARGANTRQLKESKGGKAEYIFHEHSETISDTTTKLEFTNAN